MPPVPRTNLLDNADLMREFHDADEFHAVQNWPARYMMLLLKEHKDRKERFALWNFLWANGMRPHRCTYWVLWHQSYDMNAHRDMHGLERRVETQDGQSNMRAYPTFIIGHYVQHHAQKRRRDFL